MYENDYLSPPAVHEAGHAVLAMSYGWPVDSVETWHGPGTFVGRCFAKLPPGRSRRQEGAFLAGGAAAQRLLGRGDGELYGRDVELLEHCGADPDVAIADAERILSRRLPDLRALAGELTRERELDGDDIERIVPRHRKVLLVVI